MSHSSVATNIVPSGRTKRQKEEAQQLQLQAQPEIEPPRQRASKSTTAEIAAPSTITGNVADCLLPLLRDVKCIWDPASGGKEDYPLKRFLEGNGIRVYDTDKSVNPEYEFSQFKLRKRFEAIITASPYGARKDFILRAFEIGKPFAVLVPLMTFESRSFRDVLQKCQQSSRCRNVSLVFPSTLPDSKKQPNYSVWYLFNFDGVPGVVF